MKGDSMEKMGAYAFLGGIILAILVGAGVMGMTGIDAGLVLAVLAILGVIVGFLNISDKETVGFLVSCIALVVSANSLMALGMGLKDLTTILSNTAAAISVFISPAAFIVAIKAIWNLAKD